MPFERNYAAEAPDRRELDAVEEPVVLEFGTPWCGWCRGAQPLIVRALATHPAVRHIKVEDGSGRPGVPREAVAHAGLSEARTGGRTPGPSERCPGDLTRARATRSDCRLTP